jgi:hypothetical protein
MNLIVSLDHHFNLAKTLGARSVEGEDPRYVCLGLLTELEKFVLARITHISLSLVSCKPNSIRDRLTPPPLHLELTHERVEHGLICGAATTVPCSQEVVFSRH